jgi:hypothetical protein
MKLPKYNNVDLEKGRILQENTQKSGIYMFKNLINGNRYIGSAAVDITKQTVSILFY